MYRIDILVHESRSTHLGVVCIHRFCGFQPQVVLPKWASPKVTLSWCHRKWQHKCQFPQPCCVHSEPTIIEKPSLRRIVVEHILKLSHPNNPPSPCHVDFLQPQPKLSANARLRYTIRSFPPTPFCLCSKERCCSSSWSKRATRRSASARAACLSCFGLFGKRK